MTALVKSTFSALLDVQPAGTRMEPWRQMKGETPRQYGVFVLYRDQGPYRSVDATIRAANEAGAFGNIQRRHVVDWAQSWCWPERASRWDEGRLAEQTRAAQLMRQYLQHGFLQDAPEMATILKQMARGDGMPDNAALAGTQFAAVRECLKIAGISQSEGITIVNDNRTAMLQAVATNPDALKALEALEQAMGDGDGNGNGKEAPE